MSKPYLKNDLHLPAIQRVTAGIKLMALAGLAGRLGRGASLTINFWGG